MLNALTSLQLNRRLRVLLLSFSFAYVILDFAENGAVLALLAKYPERMDLLAGILPYLTLVKRVASLLALFVPLVILVSRFLRAKLQTPQLSARAK